MQSNESAVREFLMPYDRKLEPDIGLPPLPEASDLGPASLAN